MADNIVSTSSESRLIERGAFAKQEIVRASFPVPSSQDSLSKYRPITMARIKSCKEMGTTIDRESLYCCILQSKEVADKYFDRRDYGNALIHYRSIFTVALRGGTPVADNYKNVGYFEMLEANMKKSHRIPMFLTMVSCCNRMAETHQMMGDYESAIDWLEEVEVLYDCFNEFYPESHSASSKMHKSLEYVTYHMESALQRTQIFSNFQNTSSAAHFASLCTKSYTSRYPPDIQEIRELQQKCNADSYFEMRHPDPTCIDTWVVQDATLQVRGIWSKMTPRSNVRPTKRKHRKIWMWKDKIYVAFGESDGEYAADGDAWCMNTNKMRKWIRVPDVPSNLHRFSTSGYLSKPIVFEDHAWFFSGRLEILRFNMVTEEWDKVETHADFSFPTSYLYKVESCVELYGDKLCLLAGINHGAGIKFQAFYFLDLRTCKWEHIHEEYILNGGDQFPPPRNSCISWASEKESRFFVMYGIEEDVDPQKPPYSHGTSENTNLYDLWSYNFREKAWTRERLRGNFPCHRLNPIYVFSEKQNQLILFGGRTEKFPSRSMYTTDGTTKDLSYSILADTFVLDLEMRTWRQVVTRDFPAWRYSGELLTNELGEIFLYGGMSTRRFHLGAPEEQTSDYHFTDLWRLDIDSPNSPIDEQSFLASSFSKAGCWRRCWVCKSIGTGYFQCPGSCRGKYIYCSAACQRSSWKSHKELHGCRGRREEMA